MKCKICGSKDIWNGVCFTCGKEITSTQDEDSHSDYDAGFNAGRVQATFDFRAGYINKFILGFPIVPRTLREMGFQDGYNSYLENQGSK